MKKIFTLLTILIFCAGILRAQTTTHGDLSVTCSVAAVSHDSIHCITSGTITLNLVIQNSFVGDSVKILGNGTPIFVAGNSTGQSPWTLSAPANYNNSAVTIKDYRIVGGNAHFGPLLVTKVISGPDTIFNPLLSYDYPVTGACQYDTLKGREYYDFDSNCVYNTGDYVYEARVEITSTYSQGYDLDHNLVAWDQGYYFDLVQTTWLSSYTIKVPQYYQFIFPLNACSPLSYTFTTMPQSGVDFSLKCSGNTDLSVWTGAVGALRPQMPFMLHANAVNIGCNTASGVLYLVLPANVTYNAALSINPADNVSGDTLMWNYSNLSSLTIGGYWHGFSGAIHLTPAANVNIGDTMCFEVFTNVPPSDVDPANNHRYSCIAITNSYDPNLKEVSPAGEGPQGIIPVSTPELTYTVHFQNTGTAAAFRVLVIDTLDPALQDSSLQILGSTHAMEPEWLAPGVVRFNFNSINLPDSTHNEPASHGSFSYKIKLKPSLPIGTQIHNTAGIYFDFNPPVYTNTTLNTIGTPSSIEPVSEITSLKLFPNPSTGMVTVALDKDLKNYSMKLLTVTGETAMSKTGLNGNSFNFDLSAQPAGIYFMELVANGSVLRAKVVKE